MFRNAALLTLIAGIGPLCGCSTILKQTYHTAVGAQGKFYELEKVDPAVLETYRAVKVEPFTNALAAHIPPEVVGTINANMPRVIAEEGLFYPDGKLLRVTGSIIHYTGKSGLTGAVGSTIGGSQDSVCRVQLLDDASGKLIGEAICWGSVKSALRRGAEEQGIGVGKAVAKWVSRRLPEGVAEQRRQELAP